MGYGYFYEGRDAMRYTNSSLLTVVRDFGMLLLTQQITTYILSLSHTHAQHKRCLHILYSRAYSLVE